MATANPFDLLGDGDVEDPTLFIAAQEQKAAASGVTKKAPVAGSKNTPAADTSKGAKFPTKPQPPSQAVREARNETGRVGGGRGYGRGRGSGGPNREFVNDENTFVNGSGTAMGYKEERERPYERRGGYGSPRGGFRGGRRGGFSNGEEAEGERPRRVYERRSGTGQGSEIKRDGAGRGNWGTPADEIFPETEEAVAEIETNVIVEKQPGEEENGDVVKDKAVNESEEKEPEEKQMTLEEYEKVLVEKRKALELLKVKERKVDVDKEFESMQLISKKNNEEEEVFIKLGSDKDKKKEAAEKEDRAKKSLSINEFLKPAEGETYRPGGRGRGRGGRGRGGGYSGGYSNNVRTPSIEDPSQFPLLGAN